MQVPLQITFHNMEPSEAIEARVRDKVTKLDTFYRQIISCRVVVEAPHRQPHKSSLALVVEIKVRGKDLVVKRERRHHASRDDAYLVINEVFDAAHRQLEEHTRVVRHDVKAHEGRSYGRVVRLESEAGHGFIEMPDGRSVYFARDVVEDGAFERLSVGSDVLCQVADGEGPMGPQASLVRIVGGEHHIR
jgi:ribosomal subunit interface protein